MPRRSQQGKVTLAHVAEAVGVSVATVSNAYNGTGRLSTELRQRILRVGAELGFAGANPVARGLRTGQVGAVAWILRASLYRAVENEATLQFMRGLASRLEEEAVGLLVISSASPERSARLVQDAMVDRFLAYSLADDDPLLQAARRRGGRVVVVDQPVVDDLPSIRIDSRGGARAAARHLVDLGHRDIAIFSVHTRRTSHDGPVSLDDCAGITFEVTRQRLDAYLEVLADAGLSITDIPVYEVAASGSADNCERGALWLLDRQPRPTAVLAMSDRLAQGVLAAAAVLGIRVPEELSVVGFDDVPSAVHCDPPLTTVRQPLWDKGVMAGSVLLDDTTPPPHMFPTQLVVRGSTAPPPRSRG